MTQEEIKKTIEIIEQTKDRNIVIVDFGNLVRWEDSLKWKIGIKELKNLIKHLTTGKKFLRRFYYGSDYGPKDNCEILLPWSEMVLNKALMNDFEIGTKRVKYIVDKNYRGGFVKKCDLDVEMTIDLIKEKENYDTIILFSGDGDLACTLRYLHDDFEKNSYVFAARNHLGKELVKCKEGGIIKEIMFAEDFEYRLNRNRFRI